jgi:hypothetical protein
MYDNNKKSLTAQRLKNLRENKEFEGKNGLTFQQLQDELNRKYGDKSEKDVISIGALKNYEVSDQFNSKFETGYGMNIQYLSMFADYYDVSTDYLLGNDEYKTKDNEAIRRRFGLSEKAINRLDNWNNAGFTPAKNNLEALNLILGSDYVQEFLDLLGKYLFFEPIGFCTSQDLMNEFNGKEVAYYDKIQVRANYGSYSLSINNLQQMLLLDVQQKLKEMREERQSYQTIDDQNANDN